MQRIVINLCLDADEYLKLYQGVASNVLARAVDGRTVRFPAKILQPYVTRQGVHGRFVISFDDQGRFQSIDRLTAGV